MTESHPQASDFKHAKHLSFWLRHIRMLPSAYQSADSQRMTIAYFCLSALDLFQHPPPSSSSTPSDSTPNLRGPQPSTSSQRILEEKIPDLERVEMIEWIYQRQLPKGMGGGFRGSPALTSENTSSVRSLFDTSNLAMSYTALLSLAILRDDFSRLDLEGLKCQLNESQQSDGSFAPAPRSKELDARFVYCAFAVCYMINDWSSIDVESSIGFILRSRSYDGGFGQAPSQESHGGSTYCALAALVLSDNLHRLSEHEKEATAKWLISRQGELYYSDQDQLGFNGRIGKASDSCYSFWCGAALRILNRHHLIHPLPDMTWLLDAQSPVGGISKVSGDPPDAMHSYLGTAALAMHVHAESNSGSDASAEIFKVEDTRNGGSIYQKWGLKDLDETLNCSVETRDWIKETLWKPRAG